MKGPVMASRRDRAALRRLPTTFRYSHARRLVTERQFRDLLAHGLLVRVARGVYRKTAADQSHELIEVALARPRATLCLQSALAYHGLLDENPDRHTLALPRGTRPLDTTVADRDLQPGTHHHRRVPAPRARGRRAWPGRAARLAAPRRGNPAAARPGRILRQAQGHVGVALSVRVS
jgi:hypothetical protein